MNKISTSQPRYVPEFSKFFPDPIYYIINPVGIAFYWALTVVLYLVDHPGAESPLQRHLVDDHGVLHVVAGVGDDGNDGVCAHGIVVQPDVVVVRGPEEG